MAEQKIVSMFGASRLFVSRLFIRTPRAEHVAMRQNRIARAAHKSRIRSPFGIVQLGQQPGPSVSPISLCSCARNAEQVGGFIDRAARKVAELDKLRLRGFQSRKLAQGFVQGEEF